VKKILLVHSDVRQATDYKKLLNRYEVVIANGVERAMQILNLRGASFDLLITETREVKPLLGMIEANQDLLGVRARILVLCDLNELTEDLAEMVGQMRAYTAEKNPSKILREVLQVLGD
jgi:hypothetical protein